MKPIISHVDKELILSELSQLEKVRDTHYGGNEIYVFDALHSPNLMREVARLREEAFRSGGGGTGEELDIDEDDTASDGYHQLIAWSPKDQEIIGGYRNFEKFDECYAVDSTMAERLKPYIIFTNETVDTLKIEEDNRMIEINSADSATLCRVRGIGPKSAHEIIIYRKLLGGYYSVEQISELKVVTEENFQRILPQICCDSAKIKKININFATSKELEVHPYISNRMLKKIINHRELKGGWSRIEEMVEDNILSEDEAKRLAPYLWFRLDATE